MQNVAYTVEARVGNCMLVLSVMLAVFQYQKTGVQPSVIVTVSLDFCSQPTQLKTMSIGLKGENFILINKVQKC